MPEGTERHAAFERFLRRLAETQAYALAGDPTARQIMGEYGLARWCGVPPERALWQAESMVAHAERVVGREIQEGGTHA